MGLIRSEGTCRGKISPCPVPDKSSRTFVGRTHASALVVDKIHLEMSEAGQIAVCNWSRFAFDSAIDI